MDPVVRIIHSQRTEVTCGSRCLDIHGALAEVANGATLTDVHLHTDDRGQKYVHMTFELEEK